MCVCVCGTLKYIHIENSSSAADIRLAAQRIGVGVAHGLANSRYLLPINVLLRLGAPQRGAGASAVKARPLVRADTLVLRDMWRAALQQMPAAQCVECRTSASSSADAIRVCSICLLTWHGKCAEKCFASLAPAEKPALELRNLPPQLRDGPLCRMCTQVFVFL